MCKIIIYFNIKVIDKLICDVALKQDTSVKTQNIESGGRICFDQRQMKVLVHLMHLLLSQIYYVVLLNYRQCFHMHNTSIIK